LKALCNRQAMLTRAATFDPRGNNSGDAISPLFENS
jgi:hypothetical protein